MPDLNDIAIRLLCTGLLMANAFAAGVAFAYYYPERGKRVVRWLRRLRKA